MDEEKIILFAKEGREEAFRELYEMYKRMIYQLAYRYTNSREDAQDILQETFIKAFTKIHSLASRSSHTFSIWLTRICINQCITYLRRDRRTPKLFPGDFNHESISVQSTQESNLQKKQIILLVQNAAKKLSPRQRIIFDLRYTQHRKIKEIAQFLNCSESNVKTQLSRSIAKLKKEFKQVLREP